jgi:selenoprotein W-related protein
VVRRERRTPAAQEDIVALMVKPPSDVAECGNPARPRVEIRYCPRCGWLLRAAWLAQELLTTFADELGGVTLVPADKGEFIVSLGDRVLFDRTTMGRLPEARELKQLVRDCVCPDKPLGHSERPLTR